MIFGLGTPDDGWIQVKHVVKAFCNTWDLYFDGIKYSSTIDLHYNRMQGRNLDESRLNDMLSLCVFGFRVASASVTIRACYLKTDNVSDLYRVYLYFLCSLFNGAFSETQIIQRLMKVRYVNYEI
jgi:hypothetical protein